MRKVFILLLSLVIGLVIFLFIQTPSNEREWNSDQAVLPEITLTDEEVAIKNIRNFTYRSTSDYTPSYYETTVKLSELKSVDYIVEPFGSIGAAHTFLSFGFVSGQQIAISVEIRKELGESFSPWLGMLNQYELMYVIADERDVIDLRANHRLHPVYLYPTVATPEQVRVLFVSMLSRAQKLQTEPEFYHTALSNCTTNIAKHINEIVPNKIGWDYRLLLPENSDVLAQELGLIASDLTIEEARAKYQVNERAKQFSGQADFSRLVREGVTP